ncbi:MAG: DinB family protein [Thermoanaerobaculia bacterium]
MSDRRPSETEYAAPFARYVARVPEVDVVSVLEKQGQQVVAALGGLPDEKGGFRYAPGKWSVRELVGHVLDAERVFGHRVHHIARADPAPLPGFEENDYAAVAQHDRFPLASLLAEFESLRRSHVLMLRHLDAEAWSRMGVANESPVSMRALVFIMAGHVRHHFAVLAERYGIPADV